MKFRLITALTVAIALAACQTPDPVPTGPTAEELAAQRAAEEARRAEEAARAEAARRAAEAEAARRRAEEEARLAAERARANEIVAGSLRDFEVNAGNRVYFDYDQYALRADAREVLARQAAWLRSYPQMKATIEGHADERGTREYNIALGVRRAQAVKDFLVSQGVEAARLETISYGKERPIDPGTGEAAWSRNRNGHTVLVTPQG